MVWLFLSWNDIFIASLNKRKLGAPIWIGWVVFFVSLFLRCVDFFLSYLLLMYTLDPGGANNGLFFSHSRCNLTSRRILNAAHTQTESEKNKASTSANNHLSFIAIVPIVARTMHFIFLCHSVALWDWRWRLGWLFILFSNGQCSCGSRMQCTNMRARNYAVCLCFTVAPTLYLYLWRSHNIQTICVCITQSIHGSISRKSTIFAKGKRNEQKTNKKEGKKTICWTWDSMKGSNYAFRSFLNQIHVWRTNKQTNNKKTKCRTKLNRGNSHGEKEKK